MTKSRVPFLRGLTVQLFAITVLPLTILLLLIAFGSVWLHQQDMRALVGERDERAVQSAAALGSELHHRAANIADLAALAALSNDTVSIRTPMILMPTLTVDLLISIWKGKSSQAHVKLNFGIGSRIIM